MITIYIEPNDKADLVELLEYALKKKIEDNIDNNGWNDTNYWKIRILQLEQLLAGKNPHDLIQRSTSGYVIQKPAKRNRW